VSTAGVSGLLVISMIALAAPVLAAGVQRARVPDVVIEIVAGIVVGPSVLGWVKIDQPVGLVALLGNWVERAKIDGGRRPGTTSDDRKRIGALEREIRELRRANEILKAASANFARELDLRYPR